MATSGLNKITERILAQAKEEADRILAEAEADCRKIQEDYAKQAEEIRQTLSDEAERKSADAIARAKSASAMQKRNIIGQKRSDLIDGVFSDAFAWVKNLSPEKYTDLLVGLLSAAMLEAVSTEQKNRALFGDEGFEPVAVYEIVLNKTDRESCGKAVVEGLRKKLNGKIAAETLNKLQLSSKTANIAGGGILRMGDIESNCSLEMIFSQLRRELEADVSRALFSVRGQN